MSTDGFRPLPLLGNAHLQTILSLWAKGSRLPGRSHRHRILLPDGDQLVLHDNAPPAWRPGNPVALVLHGLTGSHRSGGVVLLARRLIERGLRIFRLDFRGVGAGFSLARGSFNAGCSDDVRAVLAEIQQLAPASRILLAGISLGGNIALKLAGELGEHPVTNLARLAVLNPPLDLHACVQELMQPRNRIYERYFVNELMRGAVRRAVLFAEPPPPALAKPARLMEFDDLYTAPRGGYQGVMDYYTRASGAQFVPRIPIPTLILTARDDPFIAVEPFEALNRPAHVELRISPRGGHTGFLGLDGRGGWGWAERVIADWLCAD